MPGFTVSGLGEKANSRPVPFYKYTWRVDDLFGDVIGGTTGPLIYLKEASLPSWTFDTTQAMGASLTYKFAKSVIFDDIKVSWYDTQGLAEVIRKWRQLVWTAEEGLKPPAAYKRDSHITTLTYDLTKGVTWTLLGSWPKRVVGGDLTYSDSEIKVVEVTVSYDWAQESNTTTNK